MATRRHRHIGLDGAITELPDIIVSDEELAIEQERQAMEKAGELVDEIGNINQAKIFLKRLVRRLIRKGVLP